MNRRTSVVLAGGLGCIVFLGCGPSKHPDATRGSSTPTVPTVPTTPTTPQTGAQEVQSEAALAVYNQWEEALEKRDYERVASFYAPGATLQTGNNPQLITGGEAIAKTFKGLTDSFPDLESKTLAVMARPKRVISISLSSGTQTKPMMGMPATNKLTSFQALNVIDFDEAGKITKMVAYADNLNFLAQLGLWQGAARPPEEAAIEEATVITDGPSEETKAVLNKLTSAIAAHDSSAVAALYHPDAILNDMSAVSMISGAAIEAYWQTLFVQFPDLRYAEAAVETFGDYGVIVYKFEGTEKGPNKRFSAEPTDKALSLFSADAFRVIDGKIASQGIFMDGMAVGITLGHMKF